ncbi:galactosyl transferase GMA12/MNN10 family protein [Botrytis cinerea]
MLRRSRAKTIVLGACAIGVVFFILSRILGGANGVPSGTPPVVIVTVLDTVGYSKEYQDSVKENRIQYARKHGYTTFFPSIGDYDIQGSPNSWSKVPAARHALSKFPHSEYIWVLEQNALIMNPALKVEDHIMAPKRLESLMVKDQSIVPPDSVIKTFPNLKGENVDLVLTQDKDGLSQASFIIRRGNGANSFSIHGLTLCIALTTFRKQTFMHCSDEAEGYKDGDFVVRLPGCDQSGRDCGKEAEKYTRQWRTVFASR